MAKDFSPVIESSRNENIFRPMCDDVRTHPVALCCSSSDIASPKLNQWVQQPVTAANQETEKSQR
jgi:hypothetical protein